MNYQETLAEALAHAKEGLSETLPPWAVADQLAIMEASVDAENNTPQEALRQLNGLVLLLAVARSAADHLREALCADEWEEKIPHINWPATWQVKARPQTNLFLLVYRITKPNLAGEVAMGLITVGPVGPLREPHWDVNRTDDPDHTSRAFFKLEDTSSALAHATRLLAELE